MHRRGHVIKKKPAEKKKVGSRGDRTPPKKGEPKTAGVGKNRVTTAKQMKQNKKEKVTEIVKKKAVKKIGSRGSRKPVEQKTYSSEGVRRGGAKKPVEKKKTVVGGIRKVLGEIAKNSKSSKKKNKFKKTMSGFKRY